MTTSSLKPTNRNRYFWHNLATKELRNLGPIFYSKKDAQEEPQWCRVVCQANGTSLRRVDKFPSYRGCGYTEYISARRSLHQAFTRSAPEPALITDARSANLFKGIRPRTDHVYPTFEALLEAKTAFCSCPRLQDWSASYRDQLSGYCDALFVLIEEQTFWGHCIKLSDTKFQVYANYAVIPEDLRNQLTREGSDISGRFYLAPFLANGAIHTYSSAKDYPQFRNDSPLSLA